MTATVNDVKTDHERHHIGVERSWYLARKIQPDERNEEVTKSPKNVRNTKY